MREFTQREQLERVGERIAEYVYDYCASRLPDSPTFYMSDLAAYVGGFVTVAPDSPGRLLRALRRAGRVDYRVVNRAQSLYRVMAVRL